MNFCVYLNEDGPRALEGHHKLRLADVGDTATINKNFIPLAPGQIDLAGVPLILLERIRVFFDMTGSRRLRKGDVVLLGSTAYEYDGHPPEGAFTPLTKREHLEALPR